MHASIAEKKDQLVALCLRFGVARLEVFGSAARGVDFDLATSDADFLVEFKPGGASPPLENYLGFAEALEDVLGRPVDLLERRALEESRNYIRRRAILKGAETVYG